MLIRKVEFIKLLNLLKPGVRRSFIFVELLHLANYQIHQTSEFIEILNSWKPQIHRILDRVSVRSPTNLCEVLAFWKWRMRPNTRRDFKHSLLDLARRLQSGGKAGTVDFAIFRLQQINRHLVQSDRFNEVVHCISTVTVLLESEQIMALMQLLCRAVPPEDRNSIFHKSSCNIWSTMRSLWQR